MIAAISQCRNVSSLEVPGSLCEERDSRWDRTANELIPWIQAFIFNSR
jgi:hypothetical protein